jgi:hypothetical protein
LFSPSLDGGLPLFELFNPRRRSSSATCAFQRRNFGSLGHHSRNQFFPAMAQVPNRDSSNP